MLSLQLPSKGNKNKQRDEDYHAKKSYCCKRNEGVNEWAPSCNGMLSAAHRKKWLLNNQILFEKEKEDLSKT